ncbi:hypothetical protein HDU76_004170 [Blyttiomyces sp. JEL0837]|nr:hypothetical protein HDU76_004170 [Blyttiomyces sp. JEL0837]
MLHCQREGKTQIFKSEFEELMGLLEDDEKRRKKVLGRGDSNGTLVWDNDKLEFVVEGGNGKHILEYCSRLKDYVVGSEGSVEKGVGGEGFEGRKTNLLPPAVDVHCVKKCDDASKPLSESGKKSKKRGVGEWFGWFRGRGGGDSK